MSDEMVVPDVPESIVAYRAWSVRAGGLYGNNSTVWPPLVEMVARCENQGSLIRRMSERSTRASCSFSPCTPEEATESHYGHGCGIYAYKVNPYLRHEDMVGQYDAYADERGQVMGEVLLYGTVYEYTDGYRAEKARISCLYDSGPHVAAIAETYGVDVMPWPVESLEDRVARLQAEAEAQREAWEERQRVDPPRPATVGTTSDGLPAHGTYDEDGWAYVDADLGDGYVVRRNAAGRGGLGDVKQVSWQVLRDGEVIHEERRPTADGWEGGPWVSQSVGSVLDEGRQPRGPAIGAAQKWIKRHKRRQHWMAHPWRRTGAILFVVNVAACLGLWFGLGAVPLGNGIMAAAGAVLFIVQQRRHPYGRDR